MNRFLFLFLVSTSVCFSAERPGSAFKPVAGSYVAVADKGALLKAPVPMSMSSAPAPRLKKFSAVVVHLPAPCVFNAAVVCNGVMWQPAVLFFLQEAACATA